jgi:hypothetical protein
VSKKIKKLIKLKKLKKKNKPWKKSIKPIKIFLKIFSSVRFHKPEIKKPNQTEKNKKTEPNRTEIKPIRKSKKQYSFLFLI